MPSLPTTTSFDAVFTDALARAVKALAVTQGTYFTDDADAETFINEEDTRGALIYIECDQGIDITGSEPIGSVDEPVVVVIDTPVDSKNIWDMKGTADLCRILVVMGDSELRGTCSIHGALYCSGTLDNKGNGSAAELNYNNQVIINLNKQYVISVNIVPNTWEEYTVQ